MKNSSDYYARAKVLRVATNLLIGLAGGSILSGLQVVALSLTIVAAFFLMIRQDEIEKQFRLGKKESFAE